MALSLCGTAGSVNVGQLGCDVSKGVGKQFLIWNGSLSSYATADAFFTSMVGFSKLSKTDANKLFPLPEVQEISDASEADKTGTLGLGFSVVLVEGKPVYTIKIFAGQDLFKRLRTLNNRTVRFLEYDSNGTWWGTKSGANFVGYQGKFKFSGGKLATGQNVEEGVVTITLSVLSTTEYLDNSYYVQTSGNIGDVVGLIDAQLTYVSKASNVYKYSLSAPNGSLLGNYNVLPDYGTAIAALSASFAAKSGASATAAVTGASLAIDTITYNTGGDGLLTVTYNSTAFASAGAFIYITGPTVAQLDTGNVTGLEILSTVHAK